MILFLILGILLGAISVVFVLQNTALVTVSFLASNIQGSLALILFLAIMSGALITLLILLPSFIKDVFALAAIKKQKKALEEELASAKQALADVAARSSQPLPPINPT